ncbi:MAG: HAD family hydrolase, partial [Aggregatilineales bacterium]
SPKIPRCSGIAFGYDRFFAWLIGLNSVYSERNRNALKKVMDAGIPVILATGKTRYSAETIIAALNLDTPGIYVQGLVIFNGDGSIRHQQTLDPKICRRVMTVAEDRGFTVLAYSGNRILAHSANERTDDLEKYKEPAVELVGPLYNILGTTPINKLVLVGDPRRVKALRWQLDKQLRGEARLMEAGVHNMCEVLPAGHSKGRALKLLIKEMGVAAENMLAIGDGENDTEMLQLAGIGVAMGNAIDALKEIADTVVSDHTKDGVAEALERFVIPPESDTVSDETSETASDAPASEDSEAADSTSDNDDNNTEKSETDA